MVIVVGLLLVNASSSWDGAGGKDDAAALPALPLLDDEGVAVVIPVLVDEHGGCAAWLLQGSSKGVRHKISKIP